MKERIETLTSYYNDFAGRTHYFIVAVVANKVENTAYLNPVIEVRLGLSICNPEDEFNLDYGTTKAVERAKGAYPVLVSYELGLINSEFLKFIIEKEVAYIKKNPGKYIKGYSEAERKWLRNKYMEEIGNNFNDIEKAVVENLQTNPNFLDKVLEYVKWIRNKCKK